MAALVLSPTPFPTASSQVGVVVSQPTPAQVRESVLEKTAKLIIQTLDAIFAQEMDSLAAMSSLPEGAVMFALRPAKSADDKVPVYILRTKLMVEQNTSKTLASDLEKLSKPQATLYRETLARCISKVRGADQILLSVNLVRCEPGIHGGSSSFDYNKSNILKSKVLACILRAPPKALAYFQ